MVSELDLADGLRFQEADLHAGLLLLALNKRNCLLRVNLLYGIGHARARGLPLKLLLKTNLFQGYLNCLAYIAHYSLFSYTT